AFGGAFVVPALVLGAALGLCYNRPLQERFPIFATLKWWHDLVGYAVLFTFVFFLTGAVAYVGGVR
ncbi:MAG: hypothetical protein IJ131_00680, partial [Eggerthellaceae bacterium]|nr:hypothetical protein [Eggerthellaceae bacterium]